MSCVFFFFLLLYMYKKVTYRDCLKSLFCLICHLFTPVLSLTIMHGDSWYLLLQIHLGFLCSVIISGNAPHTFFLNFVGHKILSVAFRWILLNRNCFAPRILVSVLHAQSASTKVYLENPCSNHEFVPLSFSPHFQMVHVCCVILVDYTFH